MTYLVTNNFPSIIDLGRPSSPSDREATIVVEMEFGQEREETK